jgi:flagellar motor protein MotB
MKKPLKGQKRIRQHNSESWAVSYVDMLTLLLCFFIIFFSFDRTAPETKKEYSTLEQISSYFNASNIESAKEQVPGGKYNVQAKGAGGSGIGQGFLDGRTIASEQSGLKACAPGSDSKNCAQEISGVEAKRPTPTATAKANTLGEKIKDVYASLGKQVQTNQHKFAPKAESDHSNLKGIGDQLNKDQMEIQYKAKALVIEFPKISFFDSGATKLNKDGQATVEFLLKVLEPYKSKVNIKVQGHTDPRPLSKKHGYSDNWELSVLRATSVLKQFIQAGYPADRLTAEGFADTKRVPASAGEDYSNLRRVTLLVEER